jgi:hypothetical protein
VRALILKRIDAARAVAILSSMKRTLFLVFVALACHIAGGPFHVAGQSTEKTKLLHATLAQNKYGAVTSKFSPDTLKIYAFWKGEALKAGDKLRAVWIAEDVGFVAPRDSKITEARVTAEKPDDGGTFALARPTGGWPVGKYRLEIYVGDDLAETLKFTIEPGATVEVR